MKENASEKNFNDLFSIYYINIDKVYELKMIRNNMLLMNRVLENRVEDRATSKVEASLSAGIKGLLSSNLGSNISGDTLSAVKVSDSFVVKETKSNILDDVLNMSISEATLKDNEIGKLVRLDSLHLKLENEQLIRIFNLLSRDIIKGQVANGIDVNKALGALAKDYAYLLSAVFCGQPLLIKIPMGVNTVFESKYSIDDLLIGNVSILGIYKGKIKGSEINSNFDYFASLGEYGLSSNSSHEEEIQSSTYESSNCSFKISTSLNEKVEYAFIDLFAVVQSVTVCEKTVIEETKKKRKCLWSKRK